MRCGVAGFPAHQHATCPRRDAAHVLRRSGSAGLRCRRGTRHWGRRRGGWGAGFSISKSARACPGARKTHVRPQGRAASAGPGRPAAETRRSVFRPPAAGPAGRAAEVLVAMKVRRHARSNRRGRGGGRGTVWRRLSPRTGGSAAPSAPARARPARRAGAALSPGRRGSSRRRPGRRGLGAAAAAARGRPSRPGPRRSARKPASLPGSDCETQS
jgi:hypothetical protein